MERQLPSNLVEATGRIIAGRVGVERAIRRSDIRARLYQESPLFHTINDRQVRSAIEALRELGWLICSLGGDSEGYFVAKDMSEYEDFRRFYTSYARSIENRIRRMDKVAEKKWGGSALQDSLL